MSAAGYGLADLKELVQKDIKASHEMQARIDNLRQDVIDGKTTDDMGALDNIESEGRKMLKDLIIRIENIEDQPQLSATDREMLQALNARQVACDKQVMQLAEIRDLHRTLCGLPPWQSADEYLEAEKLPEGIRGRSRKQQAATAVEPLPELADPSLETGDGAKAAGGPTMESVAEPVDPRDIGAAPYATKYADENTHDETERSLHEKQIEEDEEEEAQPDKSTWPLCYRILDVDPATDPLYFEIECKKAYKRLSPKHDPARLPNDADAPARWAAITKAYQTLTDPDRKKYYDLQGNTPAGLEGLDLSKLSIGH